jgi:hypothetical protein
MAERLWTGAWRSFEVRDAVVIGVVTVVALAVHALLQKLLWAPLRMRRIMIRQGVAVAPFHFVVGSLPECFAFANKFSGDLHVENHYDSTPTVSPMNTLYFPKDGTHWKGRIAFFFFLFFPLRFVMLTLADLERLTGNFYLYAWGSEPRLATRDPEFAKEVLLTRQSDFGRAESNAYILGQIAGHESVVTALDDRVHETHRRVLNPHFYPEAVKVSKRPSRVTYSFRFYVPVEYFLLIRPMVHFFRRW